jgi:Ca-activated chloride channel family protein
MHRPCRERRAGTGKIEPVAARLLVLLAFAALPVLSADDGTPPPAAHQGGAARLQAPAPRAQGGVRAPERRFRTGIDVVSITATVVNEHGQLVSGLTRADFEVYEDGRRQTLTHFTGERVPIGLGLLLDASDSMRGARIRDARRSVARFLLELLDQDDEFFVMAFNHAPQVITSWTSRSDQVEPRLESIRPWGGTSIYDAVLAAVPIFERRSRQRAAIVVISDGADTASDATVRQVRSALLRSDAFVYAVAIDPPDVRAVATRVNPHALREITDDSGGRTEVVHDMADLDAATARIAEELNHQYVLGYSPTQPPDGQYRSLRVRVTTPGHRVRARRGYVAER